MYNEKPEIVSVELKDGKLEIVMRQKSNIMFASYPAQPSPDRVWKQIFKAVNGTIVKLDSIEGKHIPASTNPEQIVFPATNI